MLNDDQVFIDKIEKLRHCTYSKITELQKSLCPMVKSVYLNFQFEYWYEGYKYNLWEEDTHLYAINELPYRYDNELRNTTFIENLHDLIYQGKVWPFLLFIDGIVIQWSKIQVIHDYNYTYLKISGITPNTSTYADIIVFPLTMNNLRYGEDNGILTTPDRKGFYFDKSGYWLENTDFADISVRLEILDPNIYYRKIDISNMPDRENNILEFTGLPDGYVPTLDNIITFNNERLYNHLGPSTKVKDIYNGSYGLFKLTDDDGSLGEVRWVILMYNMRNTFKEASYLYSKAEDLNKKAITKLLMENPKEVSEEIWQDIITPLIQTFDFDKVSNIPYEEGLAKDAKYITRYDFSLWKDAFTKNLSIKSFTYTGVEFKSKADDKGYVRLSRKHSDLIEDVILIFVNHKLYKYIIDVTYTTNTINIPVFGIVDEDHIEIILYTECNNNILEISVPDGNTPIHIHPEYNLEDCDIMSTFYQGADYDIQPRQDNRLQYILDFTYTKDDKSNYLIQFGSDIYYGQIFKIVPKKQFRYYRFRRRDGRYKFILPTTFNYCHDPNRYLVFINGKKIDRTEYTITIMNQYRPFDQLMLYITTLLDDNDYIDIFYVPEPIVEKYRQESMPNSGLLLLEDTESKINYPTTYPLSKYTAMVFVNGLKVNPLDIKDVSMNCLLINVDKYRRDDDNQIMLTGQDNPIIKRNYVDSVNNITIVEYITGNKKIAGYLNGLYEQIPEGDEYDPDLIDFDKSASDAWKELIKTILTKYSEQGAEYTGLQKLFGPIFELEDPAPDYKENFADLRSMLYDIILDHYLTKTEATTGSQFVYEFERDHFGADYSENDDPKNIIIMPKKDKFFDYDVNAPIASPEDVIEGKEFGI